MLCVDEIKITDRTKAKTMSRLKNLITEDEVMINEKYQKPYYLPNRTNFVMFSNHRNAITLTDRSRRFWVVEIDRDPLSPEFYANFADMVDSNPGAIKHYFEQIDLSDFNPHTKPPVSDAFEDVVADSLAPGMARLDSDCQQSIIPFTADCNYVCPAHIKQYYYDRYREDISKKAVMDWLRDVKGAERVGQIHFGKERPIIYALDPNRPRPAELKDIAKMYMKPICKWGTDPYFQTLDEIKRIDNINELDAIASQIM